MLGEKIGETNGTITGQRVLPAAAGPTMETSFRGTGRVLGVEATETATYHATMRPDGTLYGEGQGLVMGKNGEAATWKGSGVGVLKPGGAASYRGAIYYQSASSAWLRLNSTAAIFEFEVDAQGATKGQIWEWK